MTAHKRTPLPADVDRAAAEGIPLRGLRMAANSLDECAPANECESPAPRGSLGQNFRVTFVGGPRHGQSDYFDVPPARIQAGPEGVSQSTYEARTWIGDAGTSIHHNWVAYAPVDMPRDEFLALSLAAPELQAGLAWLVRARTTRG